MNTTLQQIRKPYFNKQGKLKGRKVYYCKVKKDWVLEPLKKCPKCLEEKIKEDFYSNEKRIFSYCIICNNC